MSATIALIADSMIPEAFETAHGYAGFITVAGLLRLCFFKVRGETDRGRPPSIPYYQQNDYANGHSFCALPRMRLLAAECSKEERFL